MTTNQTKFGIIYEKIVMQAGDDEQMINYEWPKVIKIGDKVKIENCFFINKYTINKLLLFLLIGLHFHQCLTSFTSISNIILSLKEIFRSLVSKQDHMEKCFCLYGCKDLEMKKEMKLNTFSLVKLKSLLTEFYLNTLFYKQLPY